MMVRSYRACLALAAVMLASDVGAGDAGGLMKQESAWEVEFQTRLDWWSLKPMRALGEGSVDGFIQAAQKAAGLEMAPSAPDEVLRRRLSFVLTGLPPVVHPTPAPGASYESYVDMLLDSPHFGERFARHWMDVVRYTDTYGYEWDNPAKGSHEYRDYLIRAFNDDLGYDRFLREQIAGDLLPEPRIHDEARTCENLIAPMFYHLGEHRHGSSLMFNGIHQEMVDNKIDAFSKAFLATTVACARCHDHKLEAIAQRDYYGLAAMFTMPRWTARVADAPGSNDAAIGRLKELREAIREELAALWTGEGALQAPQLRKWAVEKRPALDDAKPSDISYPLARLAGEARWTAPAEIRVSASETTFVVQPDQTILATGVPPQADNYVVRFASEPGDVKLLKLEALRHASLPGEGPGRSSSGNFVLRSLKVEVSPRLADGGSGPTQTVALAAARAGHSQPGFPVESLLQPADGRRGWAIGLGPEDTAHSAVFTFAETIELPHGGDWTFTLEQSYGSSHLLGCFRLSLGAVVGSATGPQHETLRELAEEWRKRRAEAVKGNEAFSAASLEGWVFEGDGFLHGETEEASPLVALEGERVVERLLPQGWHSHALSSKLPGSLRSPPQHAVPGKFMSLKLAGGEFGGHLVVDDHAFQNETVAFYANRDPQWRSFADAELKNGAQQVAIEFCTAPLNPNFPPRTGLARGLPNDDFGYEKRSWISIAGIVTHDAAGTPQDELPAFTGLYESDAASDPWERVAAWFNGAVERWHARESLPGDHEVLDWLLANELLPNEAEPGSELARLVAEYRSAEAGIAFPRTVNSMDEREALPVKYPLNVRGDVDQPGELIAPASLSMLRGEGVGDRLALAESLVDPEHPLTARVYVNRVWQWVFGKGLVATPDDFGRLGETPSHPELLDWLAREFIRDGWSTKKLVRKLVLSETFRQDSTKGALEASGASEIDPDNRLLAYYPTRRLEAEAIRDSVLAVSGRLDPRLYGRPILPPRVAEDDKKRLFSGPLDGEGRRSIYLQMSIMEPPKFLVGFNLPDLKLPSGRRDVTNVPAQALALLNDPLVNAMARDWAEALAGSDDGDEEIIRRMFQAAYGREPDEAELRRWLQAGRSVTAQPAVAAEPAAESGLSLDALEALAHALFNTKEFIYYR